MRPAYLDNMSWAMAEVYEAVTDRLLINLAKYFPYIRNSGEMRGSFEYQARMLAQIGQVNRESTQIIIDSMAGADAALKSTLEAAIMDALKNEEPKLRHAAEKGFIPNGRIPRPILSPNQMQAFTAYYRQSADKLNLVNTVMLESTQNAYISTVSDITAKIGRTQTILNTGTGEVVTGVSTWNQAVQTSVKKMLDNGLTGFIDHGGHRWSPEAYAAMDIRTTVFNTARDAIWERANDYGCDLYQVSSHNGARPLCFPWQAKIISRNDWTGEVQDIDGTTVHVYAQSETSYGEAAGLFGVNCKHYPMTFIPNFSSLKGEPQSEEENAEAYALSQEQRGLERKLREEKRDLEVMKAQGASEEQIAAQKRRVSIASSKIDEFCDEHELPRRRNRETAPIRATWVENPANENSPFVERYQGDYIPVNQSTPTTFERVESYRKEIDEKQAQIDSMNGEYGKLVGESIVKYGTEEGAEAERRLREIDENVTILSNDIKTTRANMEQFLTTGDEREIFAEFGTIKGAHGIYDDAKAVNVITDNPLSQNNCGFCCLAYDARRRGIDCTAPLIQSTNELGISRNWAGMQFASATSYNPTDAMREIATTAESWGTGARGIVSVDWTAVSGHFFSFEVNADGVCEFIDSQTGSTKAGILFDGARSGSVRFARTDDKELTVSALLNLKKGGK